MSARLPPPFWDERSRRWHITRYADVADLLGRGDLMVAEFGDGLVELSSRSGKDLSALTDALARIPLFLNPPVHSPERRIFARTLAAVSAREIEAIVLRHATRLCARAVAAGGMDAAADFADVVAMAVIVELLGLPEEDIPLLNTLIPGLFAITNESASLSLFRSLNARADQCTDYLMQAIRMRRARPGDDGISRMLAVAPDEDERHTAARIFALLVVGTETSATFISHTALRLIEHPHERAMLAARPDRCERGVDELIRLSTPARFVLRSSDRETVVGGAVIPAGHRMKLDLHAANRDPEAFRKPDAVDLDNTVPHLAFSDGLHLCLGARFARIEGLVVLPELLALPPMRLLEEAATADVSILPRIKSLPVAFE